MQNFVPNKFNFKQSREEILASVEVKKGDRKWQRKKRRPSHKYLLIGKYYLDSNCCGLDCHNFWVDISFQDRKKGIFRNSQFVHNSKNGQAFPRTFCIFSANTGRLEFLKTTFLVGDLQSNKITREGLGLHKTHKSTLKATWKRGYGRLQKAIKITATSHTHSSRPPSATGKPNNQTSESLPTFFGQRMW